MSNSEAEMNQKAEQANSAIVVELTEAIVTILISGLVVCMIMHRRRQSSTELRGESITVEIEGTTIVDKNELSDGEFEHLLISDGNSISSEELSENVYEGLAICS
jgi:hypothetical protein